MIKMKSEHILALVTLILGVLGGVLLCKDAVNVALKLFEGSRHISVVSIMLVVIGIIVIIASAMLWVGRYLVGGVINIVLGIITVFYGKDAEGLMILISGILGVLAPKIKD